jgi:DinB superfamily
MNQRTRLLHDHLSGVHAETWAVLSSLRSEDLEMELYVEGEAGWKVRDAVAHLADAERGLLGQIRRLVAGQPTLPDNFDLNRWNRGAVRKRAGQNLQALLDELRSGHEEAIAFLATISESDFDRVGRHASGEMLTTEGYFRRMGDHRRTHVADISRALAKAGRKDP